jgi:hypothetical protein
VSAETRAQIEAVEVIPDSTSPARIASYTVLFDGDEPARGVLLCDLPDGRRTLMVNHDPALPRQMMLEEFCGRQLEIAAGGDVRMG